MKLYFQQVCLLWPLSFHFSPFYPTTHLSYPPLLIFPASLSFSLPLSLSLSLDTLIYSVHCCFNRPLCPGVGIITELPSRLIGLEPAITSVLLEYTDTQTQTGTLKHKLPTLILLLVSLRKKATLASGFNDTVGAP